MDTWYASHSASRWARKGSRKVSREKHSLTQAKMGLEKVLISLHRSTISVLYISVLNSDVGNRSICPKMVSQREISYVYLSGIERARRLAHSTRSPSKKWMVCRK